MSKLANTIVKFLAEKTLGKKKHNNKEIAEARLSTCFSCGKFDKDNTQCTICGCFMDVKVYYETNINPQTLKLEITHCPLGKWGDSVIANIYNQKII